MEHRTFLKPVDLRTKTHSITREQLSTICDLTEHSSSQGLSLHWNDWHWSLWEGMMCKYELNYCLVKLQTTKTIHCLLLCPHILLYWTSFDGSLDAFYNLVSLQKPVLGRSDFFNVLLEIMNTQYKFKPKHTEFCRVWGCYLMFDYLWFVGSLHFLFFWGKSLTI